MHEQATRFMLYVKELLPDFFRDKRVLDVGSGDINGNNRYLFSNCMYDGNDVVKASNVTIVSKTTDLKFVSETFDTIVSTECFEHDPEYHSSLRNMYRMLKQGGVMAFTCASVGRPEHGTRRTSPQDSYGTIGGLDSFQDYYHNVSIDDLREIFDLDELFESYNAYYNYISRDLYFVGVKKQQSYLGDRIALTPYSDLGVIPLV